jgi:hypothetical protein
MNESKYLVADWGQDQALIDRTDWSIVAMTTDNKVMDVYGDPVVAHNLHDTDFVNEDGSVNQESNWDDAITLLKVRHPYKEREALIKVAVFTHQYGITVVLAPWDLPEGHVNAESSEEEIARILAFMPDFEPEQEEFVDVTILRVRDSKLNRPVVA